jgi:hypothetical protein
VLRVSVRCLFDESRFVPNSAGVLRGMLLSMAMVFLESVVGTSLKKEYTLCHCWLRVFVVVGKRDAVRAEVRDFKKRGETTFTNHSTSNSVCSLSSITTSHIQGLICMRGDRELR